MTGQDMWRPVLFDAACDDQFRLLEELLAGPDVAFVHDTISDQLGELITIREPGREIPSAELERRIAGLCPDRDRYGTWVFYPWSRSVVHLLTCAEHREVRTNRNLHKITETERARLATARIGVVGLSVGNMAAVTLALGGIGGGFRLADFDRLSLSNLNRLRARVSDLGVPKTVLAAREMFEIDPWLDIELYSNGIDDSTVDGFVAGLDLVVEECDDLHAKLLVRERARELRVPVIMDTSDRGLLDVERFDREPGRPVFHGLLGDVRAETVRTLGMRDKVPMVLRIVDGERISTRAAASMLEIGQTIGSWPQLASDVALGGAVVADVARRILLGEHTESGRYYVDIESLVANGQGQPRIPDGDPVIIEEARGEPPLPAEPEPVWPIGPDVARWIAAVGALAPSAHNAQPWQLRWRANDNALECRRDRTRDLPSLDFEGSATSVAFGALIENVDLAARHVGLRVETQCSPDPDLVCTLRFRPGTPETDPLFPFVARRVTNRRRDGRVPLDEAVLAELTQVCAAADARLQLLTSDPDLDEIGALVGASDRISLLDPFIHRDATNGFRWTPEEVRATRHGLDVATMELTGIERAGMRLAAHEPAVRVLDQIGGGRVFEDLARDLVASASAVGLITVPGVDRDGYLRGGRALQRMWLAATRAGLAVHPLAGLPFLFARLERGAGRDLAAGTRRELEALRRRYITLFETRPDHAEIVLVRLGRAGPPSGRSLRRPLEEILTFH